MKGVTTTQKGIQILAPHANEFKLANDEGHVDFQFWGDSQARKPFGKK